jgi:DNA transformation protein
MRQVEVLQGRKVELAGSRRHIGSILEDLVAVSDAFLTFALDQLRGIRGLEARRMFGGVGLYGEDTFFAVIDNDTMFVKVDDATVARYKKARMPPFNPMPDKGPMLGYYQVPARVLEDAEGLTEWAREAIGVGKRGKSVKKKK